MGMRTAYLAPAKYKNIHQRWRISKRPVRNEGFAISWCELQKTTIGGRVFAEKQNDPSGMRDLPFGHEDGLPRPRQI